MWISLSDRSWLVAVEFGIADETSQHQQSVHSIYIIGPVFNWTKELVDLLGFVNKSESNKMIFGSLIIH